MRLSILGSGSSGNAAVISCGETHLLIDAGLSAAQLCARLVDAGLAPEQLSAILLTHEHGDHCRGLDVLTRKHEIPIYCTAQTREVLAESLKSGVARRWRMIERGAAFFIGTVQVETFSVPHDAVDPLGFVLRADGASLGVLTDVGHVTQLIRARMAGVNTLFIEANYDSTLLQNCPKRPWSTKQRIMSRHGHLSNQQTAECVADLAHEALERIVLGHLSQDCNQPALARAAVAEMLTQRGFAQVDVHCACQNEITPWFKVRERMPAMLDRTEVMKIAAGISMMTGGMIQGELL